jgi:hypothetical protein
MSQKHSDTAGDLIFLREKILSLLTDIKSRVITLQDAVKLRDEIIINLSNAYKIAPRTNYKAYKEAVKALKFNEEYSFTDDEINVFLPNILKKYV